MDKLSKLEELVKSKTSFTGSLTNILKILEIKSDKHYSKLSKNANEYIFHENDPGDNAYIIQSGSVLITKIVDNKEIILATLTDNDIFGEMALIDNKLRSASAKTLTDCTFITISQDQFNEHLNNYDPILRIIMKRLVQIIRKMDNTVKST